MDGGVDGLLNKFPVFDGKALLCMYLVTSQHSGHVRAEMLNVSLPVNASRVVGQTLTGPSYSTMSTK